MCIVHSAILDKFNAAEEELGIFPHCSNYYFHDPLCTVTDVHTPRPTWVKAEIHSLHRFSKAVVMSMLQKGMGIREKSLTCLKDFEEETKDDIIN